MNAKTRIRKKVLSLHGLHGLHSLHGLQSAWSAFWGDRLEMPTKLSSSFTLGATSLPEVFKYHHLDVNCEIRNFVTDCRAMCALLVELSYLAFEMLRSVIFLVKRLPGKVSCNECSTGCFSIAYMKMDLSLPFDAIS